MDDLEGYGILDSGPWLLSCFETSLHSFLTTPLPDRNWSSFDDCFLEVHILFYFFSIWKGLEVSFSLECVVNCDDISIINLISCLQILVLFYNCFLSFFFLFCSHLAVFRTYYSSQVSSHSSSVSNFTPVFHYIFIKDIPNWAYLSHKFIDI